MSQQPQLSMGTKIGWGFTDAGVNVFVFLKSVVILAYMTQYMGVSASVAGWITFAVVISDMVTDPIVGSLSDRLHSRFGRRRPLMLIGVVLMFALTYLIFVPPAGVNPALWVLVFYALASIGFTMVAVPFGAMATDLTSSKNERTTMMGFRMVFASIGLLIAGLVATPNAIDTGGIFTWLIIALLMGVPVVTCVLATGPATQRTMAPATTKAPTLGEQFTILARSPAFVRHMLSYGIMTLGVAIISGGILFITTDIAIRKAANGAFDNSLPITLGQIKAEDQVKLGLVVPADGYVNTAGDSVPAGQVQRIDPTQPGWVAAIDYDALNDSAFGRDQVAAVNALLKGAVIDQTSGPARILVSLAGFFSAVFAMFLLGSILSQALWVPLAKAIGRDRTLIIGLVAYGVLLIGYLSVLRGGNLDLIIYGAFFLGACNGAYQNLPWAILPTLIDKANAQQEANVEGIFNGFWLSGQKIANAVGPLIFAQIIALYGYVESSVGFQLQPDSASQAMEFYMTVLPGIFFLLAIPLFLSVPKHLRS